MNVSTITSTDDARHVYSVTFPDDHDAVHHHQFDVSGPPARFLESCEIAHPRFAKGHPVCPRLAERIAHRLFDIQPQESTRLIGELIAQEVIEYCQQANISQQAIRLHAPNMPRTRRQRRVWRLMQEWGPRCIYCEKKLSLTTATIDHFVPRSRGGTGHYSNLRLSCKPCNSWKADRLPEEIMAGFSRAMNDC
jgi:5-methylcytosine-specific restriction endonuclease McrA